MQPERWQRIERLYHAALERDAKERAAFLEGECAGDERLRSEVESLIASHEGHDSFLAQPAFDLGLKALAAEQDEPLVGRSVGPYLMLSLIGSGGMGEVYLARDPRLDRKVAIKVLPASLTSDADHVRRFRQEARAASTISHPNVAHVYEVGEESGRQYIAMEFIDGVTLRQHLSQAGRLAPPEAVSIALQVGSALAAAHAAGVLHRDVKPENIMLRRDHHVKVLDFGLAKLTARRTTLSEHPSQQTAAGWRVTNIVNTEPGLVMGTANYMSPEQARGEETDARSDIWGLGVVLYEMLAGRTPFEGRTNIDVVAEILKSNPPPLRQYLAGASPALEGVSLKMLAKDADERYQSVLEVLPELRRLSGETGIADESRYAGQSEAVSSSVDVMASPYRSGLGLVKDKVRRPRALVMAFAATLVAALGSVFVFSRWQNEQRLGVADAAIVAAIDGRVVSRWRGDGNGFDNVGTNHAALHNGASFTEGKWGQALDFDGADDYAEAPAVNLPAGTSPRTVELWFKANDFDSLEAYAELFIAGYGDFSDAKGRTFHLGVGKRLHPVPQSILFVSTWEYSVQAEMPLQAGRWYHLAATVDREQNVTLYLDGEFIATGKIPFDTPSSGRFLMGRIPGDLGSVRKLNGAVDEVNVYNRELTSAEVRALYRRTEPQHATSESKSEAAKHFGLGYTLEKQKRFAEAEGQYRQAVKLEPDSALYHSGVAYTLGNQGKFAESETYYRNAVRLDPTRALYRAGLGWVLGELQKYDEAELELQQALKLNTDPDNTVYHNLLKKVRNDHGKVKKRSSKSASRTRN